MSPLLTSLIVFACIFVGAFLGLLIRYGLPDRHLSGDTKDIVRQGTGLIATLASLVLDCSSLRPTENSRPRAARSNN
jgi:hypothetical protein